MHDDRRRKDARDSADEPGAQADERLQLTVAVRRYPPLDANLTEEREHDHDGANQPGYGKRIHAGQDLDPEDRSEGQAHQHQPKAAQGAPHIAAAKRLPGIGNQKRNGHQRDRRRRADHEGHGRHRNRRKTAPG